MIIGFPPFRVGVRTLDPGASVSSRCLPTSLERISPGSARGHSAERASGRGLSDQRLAFSNISAHQINQVLQRVALRSEWAGLYRYAVPDPIAVVQKIGNPGPPGTLRRFQHAP